MRMGRWSLAQQFVVTGGAMMFIAMLISGHTLSAVVSRAAIDGTASSTALLVDSILAPVTTDLTEDLTLDEDALAALRAIFSRGQFAQRFPHLDIWLPTGEIIYSRDPALVGRNFAPPPGVAAAAEGLVHAEFTDLAASEHVSRNFSQSFLEIYLPLRNKEGVILAIAEIHEHPGLLEAELQRVRGYTWMIVGVFSLLLMLGLTGIVHRAGRLIESQKADLHQRISEIERISRQNASLRDKARAAGGRMGEMVEATLRRIGAELHDGPAQQLGYAALVAGSAQTSRSKRERDHFLDLTAVAVRDALSDIRSISKGLILPELENLSLGQVIERAIRNHEKRTATTVLASDAYPPVDMPHAIKLCAYRFVQEGLSNAYQHAGGLGQQVACALEERRLTIAIRDHGGPPRLARMLQAEPDRGLGLVGLRERIEALGGSLDMCREVDGTTLTMSIGLGGAKRDV